MSNDTEVLARLWKLWAMICKMIMDGKREAVAVADILQGIVSETAQQVIPKILRCVCAEGLFISATTGTRFIANAKDLFRSGIDGDFKKWNLAQANAPTNAMKVEIHEMGLDATFVQMFGSLASDLDLLCFTQDQIIAFCIENSGWLRTEGYGTFFLFKENEQYFVARVGVASDGLGVAVYRLGYASVWFAMSAHRVVVPQQAL